MSGRQNSKILASSVIALFAAMLGVAGCSSDSDPNPSGHEPSKKLTADKPNTESGDIVWVNMVSGQEFQGQTLRAGWNLVSLK